MKGEMPGWFAAGMDAVLTAFEESFDLADCEEITVEAGRPDTITREKLETLARHNIGRISINPEEAETVRLIFHKYALEQLSAARIAAFLEQEGYRTQSGSTGWTAGAVRKILRNEKYVGDLIQKKTYTPDYLTHARKPNRGEVPLVTIADHHEPLISREIWNLTQERLSQNNKHRKGHGGHSSGFLFSGRIRCGQCGAAFVSRWKYRKDGTKFRRWSCGTAARKGAESCDVGKLLREDDALQMLKTALRNLPELLESIPEKVTALAMEAIAAEEENHRDLPRQIRSLQWRKEKLLDGYCGGQIPEKDMLAMKEHYDTLLEICRKQLAEAEKRRKNLQKLEQDIQKEAAAILTMETESEVFCKTILDTITVFRDRSLELRLKELPAVFHFLG